MSRIPPAPAVHPWCEEGCHYDLGSDPCGGDAIAWRWDPHEGGSWYPVCRRHAHGRTSWPTPTRCKEAGQPYRRPTSKPKGPTRAQLRKQCDDIFAAIIRSEGDCAAAESHGLPVGPCSGSLQCAHIVSRHYLGTRWTLINAMALCQRHHLLFTRETLLWELWREMEVGVGLYEELRVRAFEFIGPPNYEAVLANLEALRDYRAVPA